MEILKASVIHAKSILNVQKRAWLCAYPNKEFGISEEDIALHFSNSGERVCRTTGFLAMVEHDPSYFCLVIKNMQRIIGYCIAEKDNKLAELGSLYIDPDYQWQGIGSDLMSKLIRWVNGMNIFLWVASYNRCAIRFYEKFGFIPTNDSRLFTLETIGKSISAIGMLRVGKNDLEYISE